MMTMSNINQQPLFKPKAKDKIFSLKMSIINQVQVNMITHTKQSVKMFNPILWVRKPNI